MSKIILDLCGGTGSWSKPYKDAGYIVHVITLPEHDIYDWQWDDYGQIHFPDDLDINISDIYGVLAAPPCTMFSLARKTTAKMPRDFQFAMEIVHNCMKIVWYCQGRGEKPNLKFWALENPRGYLRQFLGKPAITIYQSEFGADINKPTDLWGYFNKPRPTHLGRRIKESDGDLTWQRMKSPAKGLTRADMRAITPKGFADAFYKANP